MTSKCLQRSVEKQQSWAIGMVAVSGQESVSIISNILYSSHHLKSLRDNGYIWKGFLIFSSLFTSMFMPYIYYNKNECIFEVF